MSDLFNDARSITNNISLPEVEEIFISDNYCELNLDNVLESDELFLEPRSINSSEFSDSSEDNEDQEAGKKKPCAKVRSQSNNKDQELDENSDLDISPNLSSGSLIGMVYNGRSRFTPEQDSLILSLYKKYGGSWKKISGIMGDGLTPSMIKNRFYKRIKKRAFPHLVEKKPQVIISKEVKEENEKKSHLSNLYEKAKTIEEFLKKAKLQIDEIELKKKQKDKK